MKLSHRNFMLISFTFCILMIQFYPINAGTVLEYKANIGDVTNYSVIKLNHLSKSGENWIRESIQLNRTIFDIYYNKFTFLEQQGTRYTLKVIQVNNSGVYGDFKINNEQLCQVHVTSFNYYLGFIMKTTSNQTYFEQLSINSAQYELNQSYLYETIHKATAGGPCVSAGVAIHNVWDIETGWLESCHFTAFDSSLPYEIEQILYGSYEYEIKIDSLTRSFLSLINGRDFLFLSFITLGTSSIFIAIYSTRFKIGA